MKKEFLICLKFLYQSNCNYSKNTNEAQDISVKFIVAYYNHHIGQPQL